MKPDEIVRVVCITAYNMDLDVYEKLGLPQGKWPIMQKDFTKWFCALDSENSEKFTAYALGKRS